MCRRRVGAAMTEGDKIGIELTILRKRAAVCAALQSLAVTCDQAARRMAAAGFDEAAKLQAAEARGAWALALAYDDSE